MLSSYYLVLSCYNKFCVAIKQYWLITRVTGDTKYDSRDSGRSKKMVCCPKEFVIICFIIPP